MAAPEICPNCGVHVPPRARACPGCGADEQTGWSEEAGLERLGVPSEDFDYDGFIREEFGGQKPEVRPRGVSALWWIVAIGLILMFLSFYF